MSTMHDASSSHLFMYIAAYQTYMYFFVLFIKIIVYMYV